jgi:glycosyltransferase involved in cell wall biosynthesis
MVPDDFLGKKLVEGGIPQKKIFKNVNPFFVDRYITNGSHKGYILYVGRLTRQKGVITLINAMSQVQSDIRLYIVGSGELDVEARAIVNDNKLSNRVLFLGAKWEDEVITLINEAIAIIIPSEWYDNLPLILCQANAAGKPVIASRINGIPEYVEDMENGFLFQPGNKEELAKNIDNVTMMSDEEYRRLSFRSRRTAERIFDYPSHYKILLNVIESLTS